VREEVPYSRRKIDHALREDETSMQNILREQAKKAIDELSDEKVMDVIEFIEYLRGKEETEATLEIMSNREFMAKIEKAEMSIGEGNTEDLILWEKVKRDV
jgi:hypothetical protein